MASPNEPLRVHIHTMLLGIDYEQTQKQNRQFPVLAGNITSLVRTISGPDAELKHVSIRVANIRANDSYGAITAQKAQIVVHSNAPNGDKLLAEVQTRLDTNLIVALAEEVDRVTIRAMEALKAKEDMDEATMMAAIQNEQF